MKNTQKKETDTTQDDFLKVYYISADQTSLLQVGLSKIKFLLLAIY